MEPRAPRCSQCHVEDTEYYCNTCKCEMCLRCKERHVINLHARYHDVMIYNERYETLPILEDCARHLGNKCKKFCVHCSVPFCVKCRNHFFHKVVNLRKVHDKDVGQHRHVIHNIRSDFIFRDLHQMSRIKTDMAAVCIDISQRQSEIAAKAEKLTNFVHINLLENIQLLCNLKFSVARKFNALVKLVKREAKMVDNYEQSGYLPIQWLLSIKKMKAIPSTCTIPIPRMSLTEKNPGKGFSCVLDRYTNDREREEANGK